MRSFPTATIARSPFPEPLASVSNSLGASPLPQGCRAHKPNKSKRGSFGKVRSSAINGVRPARLDRITIHTSFPFIHVRRSAAKEDWPQYEAAAASCMAHRHDQECRNAIWFDFLLSMAALNPYVIPYHVCKCKTPHTKRNETKTVSFFIIVFEMDQWWPS